MSSKIKYTENELLIIRFFSDKASEVEKKQVINLLQTDNNFKKLYLSMQKTVNAVDALMFYDSIDEEEALNKIYLKAEIKEIFTDKKKQLKPFNIFLKIASVIILGVVTYVLFQNRTQQVILSATETKLLQQILPDSSIVDLNINSSVQYSNKYGSRNRMLKLSGEAFFSVKKNKKLPFIVDCNGLYIEVTGTTFSIRNNLISECVKVYVNSGQVKIYNKEGENIILDSGEIALYNKTEKTLNKSRNGIGYNTNAWLNQKLNFDDCPLQQVINDINNYYKVNIQLNVNDLRNCRLSANFENASLESVLEIICLSFGLEIINKEEMIILKGDGC